MRYLDRNDYPDEKFVGQTVNGYEIQYVCDYKNYDGHKMYHGKCVHCGKEFERRKQDFLKDSNEKDQCRHVTWAGPICIYSDLIVNERLRKTFSGMCTRCYDKTDKSYRWYGAKGITVCEKWLHRPDLFEKWAYENGYEDTLTIDRMDETKGYYPENCRWISREDNAKYKSTTNLYTIGNETHTGKDWAKVLDLGPNTINKFFREYPHEQVVEFIKRRKIDPTKTRKSKQTWMEVYGLE